MIAGGDRDWMMTAYHSFLVLDKDTAEFSFSCFQDDMCNVPDKANRIQVVGGEDGVAVHIAVLTKYFLEVFVQGEDSGKWVSKTGFSWSQAVRELFGEKIKKPHISVDKLKEIVWVAEGSVVLGAEDEGFISVDLATMKTKRVHGRDRHHGPVYKYQLPWPPIIRACLPL
ncbi:hypothetical protein D1007_16563 [Hordeum vulgare]|nr:hypothetical protein D1007_16563 [Hordeum vulgare]